MPLERHSRGISKHSSRTCQTVRRRSNFLESARALSNEQHCRKPAAMPKPPPASTRNPAFQSKLEPYREFIRECRAKRWSYPRIAAALREFHGLSAAPSTIFSFVKVRAKRRRLYALPSDDSPVFQPTQANPTARNFFTPPEPKETHEAKRRPYNI
jgi:transposase